MKETIIGTGAEAVLIQNGLRLIKRRIKKSYRLPILDEKLRKGRTKSEAKLLEKAGKLIPVPKVIKVSDKNKEIDMEFISGLKLSESLDSLKNAEEICKTIGQQIAKLHDNNIIHGDLTTSNMIYVPEDNSNTSDKIVQRNPSNKKANDTSNSNKSPQNAAISSQKGKLYFIDFGLGFISARTEDKAVDLHLIKQALEAKHFLHSSDFFKEVLEGYKHSANYKETLNRLKKVESRGRYKQAD